MNSITRGQFCAAIQAGITSAGGRLTERQRDALRQIAVSANVVGDNFATGCPWALAEALTAMPDSASSFYPRYDDLMVALNPDLGYLRGVMTAVIG